MSKKSLNQNSKYNQELINTFEPDFTFDNKPINRVNILKKNNSQLYSDKQEKLEELKKKITSIVNCNLKDSSKN